MSLMQNWIVLSTSQLVKIFCHLRETLSFLPFGDLNDLLPFGDLSDLLPFGDLSDLLPFGDLNDLLPFGDLSDPKMVEMVNFGYFPRTVASEKT
ncbi:hypothetical protein BV898_10559 [Hypsibius exemplaris]|uniref:Uncharacterized protein n=1 Tax=Hypsibius exemplaris TaxID=2072580 RepID=A0A1W0WJN2_HYPEX|nr:hypothetical protein BV898_10559 [Hypsibius exemplaris]